MGEFRPYLGTRHTIGDLLQLRRHSGATRLRASTSELELAAGSAHEQTSSEMLTLARRLPRARPALRALGSRSMSLKYSKDHEWIKMESRIYTHARDAGIALLHTVQDRDVARTVALPA